MIEALKFMLIEAVIIILKAFVFFCGCILAVIVCDKIGNFFSIDANHLIAIVLVSIVYTIFSNKFDKHFNYFNYLIKKDKDI